MTLSEDVGLLVGPDPWVPGLYLALMGTIYPSHNGIVPRALGTAMRRKSHSVRCREQSGSRADLLSLHPRKPSGSAARHFCHCRTIAVWPCSPILPKCLRNSDQVPCWLSVFLSHSVDRPCQTGSVIQAAPQGISFVRRRCDSNCVLKVPLLFAAPRTELSSGIRYGSIEEIHKGIPAQL